MTTKLREMGDRLVATNEDIQRSLTQGNTLTERAYADISRSYENLRNEVCNSIIQRHCKLFALAKPCSMVSNYRNLNMSPKFQ